MRTKCIVTLLFVTALLTLAPLCAFADEMPANEQISAAESVLEPASSDIPTAEKTGMQAKDPEGTGAAIESAYVMENVSVPEAEQLQQEPPMGAMDASPAVPTVEGNHAVIADTVDMHRLYNPNSGEHFYTASPFERDSVVAAGWSYEGVGWIAPVTSDFPVFRVYNPNAGDHHYTMSAFERDQLLSVGWNDEGIGWYSADSGGIAVLRQYNPNAATGTHNYTTSEFENDYLASVGWNAEGIGWYACESASSAEAPYLTATFTNGANKALETIVSYAEGENTYLLFPSYAPLTSVMLAAFDNASTPVSALLYNNGYYDVINPAAALNLTALGATVDEDGSYRLSFKRDAAGRTFALIFMKSAAVSTVYVNSNDISSAGRAYVEASADHSAKAQVAVTVLNANGDLVYDNDTIGSASSTIKGRGNSTWGIGNKKPYQISLDKKADLLESGDKNNKNKKWILLANAGDATLLHNSIAFDLGLEMGLLGTQGKLVDLYYDGEYRGSYYLCEKIEIKEGRIDITDLEGLIKKANPDVDLDSLPTEQAKNAYGYTFQYVTGVVDPADITGGYLIERDNPYYNSEKCWFDTSVGKFAVKSPEVCSQNCMQYISEYVQEAIDKLKENKFNEGASFDLDTLAKTYVISDFLKNIDAFLTSTYFYKNAGDTPLFVEPLWDFDTSTGTRTDWYDNSFRMYEGFVLPHVPWITVSSKLTETARNLYINSLLPLVRNVLLGGQNTVGAKGILHSLTYYQNLIANSQKMNEVLYGITNFPNTITPFSTYDLNVRYMRNWMDYRSQWITTNIEHLAGSPIHNPQIVYDGVDYADVYDYYYYVSHYPDVAAAFGGDEGRTLQHFVESGMKEGRQASLNFNVFEYRDKYGDLQTAFGDDLEAYYRHFIEHGFLEGRLIA